MKMILPSWFTNEKTWKEMVMYVAHPTKLRHLGEEIEAYAYKAGFSPVNPFGCGQYKYFEGGRMGRPRTLDYGLSLQKTLCGNTGVFGISDGVMNEVRHRLTWDREKNIWIFKDAGFDPDWDSEYFRFSKKYGDLFAEIRGKKWLIAFVGPSAIGKTYWIENLKRYYGQRLERVKNVTTRLPRDSNDKKYYYIVSKEQFEFAREECRFMEHDEYLGNYYGSSLEEIKRVLRSRHGAFAITPEGAKALYTHRLEFNIKFILLVPESEVVLRKNLERRGIEDKEKQQKYIDKASKFILPPEIKHERMVVTGTKRDKHILFDHLNRLLKS
ncbi:hypothetical protein GW950_00340 [Candidatus Wolfebacteria bacterium]|nr:hypothetical protein [Candidatus Wolfebacteria bacterium]